MHPGTLAAGTLLHTYIPYFTHKRCALPEVYLLPEGQAGIAWEPTEHLCFPVPLTSLSPLQHRPFLLFLVSHSSNCSIPYATFQNRTLEYL